MKTKNAIRNVEDQREKSWDWILEVALFVMLAPAMIYDFISLGTFSGL